MVNEIPGKMDGKLEVLFRENNLSRGYLTLLHFYFACEFSFSKLKKTYESKNTIRVTHCKNVTDSSCKVRSNTGLFNRSNLHCIVVSFE